MPTTIILTFVFQNVILISIYFVARTKINYLPVVKADKDIARLYIGYNLYLTTNPNADPITSILDMFSRLPISVLRASEPALRLHRLKNCSNISVDSVQPRTKYSRCMDPPVATRSQLGQTLLNMIYKESALV